MSSPKTILRAALILVVLAWSNAVEGQNEVPSGTPTTAPKKGTKDIGKRIAMHLLGRCSVKCQNCPTGASRMPLTVHHHSQERNVTVCSKHCDVTNIQCIAKGHPNCVCPPPASPSYDTCGRGTECDLCDPAFVTEVFGWKVCCRGCAKRAVSFILDNNATPPRPVCRCNVQTPPVNIAGRK